FAFTVTIYMNQPIIYTVSGAGIAALNGEYTYVDATISSAGQTVNGYWWNGIYAMFHLPLSKRWQWGRATSGYEDEQGYIGEYDPYCGTDPTQITHMMGESEGSYQGAVTITSAYPPVAEDARAEYLVNKYKPAHSTAIINWEAGS